jgi:malate dehydrogenase (oxaloacetate-decarboxylating)
VVVLAALHNAARRAGRRLEASVIGQIGLGAAGIGIVRLLRATGAPRILGADRNPAALEHLETLGGVRATLEEVMRECDIVVATTGVKGLIRPELVRPGQVILALSNPDPEIEPSAALERGAAFAADGKGINNVLGFPGLFKGALAARAPAFTDAMLTAAAHCLADLAPGTDLVPNALDPAVHVAVTEAVRLAATA